MRLNQRIPTPAPQLRVRFLGGFFARFRGHGLPFAVNLAMIFHMPTKWPNTFKVVQLNAENLFIYLDDLNERDWRNLAEKDWQKLSSATVANKSLVKTLWLADSILDMDPDIVCLNEVGGQESLVNF